MRNIIFSLFLFLLPSTLNAGSISPVELLSIGKTSGQCEIIETFFYLKHHQYKDSKEIEHFLTNYMNAFLEQYNSSPKEHQETCRMAFSKYKELYEIFNKDLSPETKAD